MPTQVKLLRVLQEKDKDFVFTFGTRLKDIEKEIIMETVNRLKGNKTKAARMLGMGLRTL